MSYNLDSIEKLLKDIEERRNKAKKKAHNKKIGYAPKCKVCNSEWLDEIENLREEGFTYKEIQTELSLHNISIMSLSRHFKNHYPKSQAYKDKQQLQLLENIREAYIKYPFLEDYFKDKDLKYLEEFNTECGFCTDKFGLCTHLDPSTVSNGYDNIFNLYNKQVKEIEEQQANSFSYYNNDKTTSIQLKYNTEINICLNCKNQIQENRINLLEKIITYNFLNIPPENKELYFNLLQFNGNSDDFIKQLMEINKETQAK